MVSINSFTLTSNSAAVHIKEKINICLQTGDNFLRSKVEIPIISQLTLLSDYSPG